MPDSLDSIRTDLFQRIEQGARDRNSAMHTPAVATAEGDARIMVLRDFDRDRALLRFHTDARAPKVSAIETDRRVGVLFYDRDAKIQIRCRGQGRIEREGSVADAAWAQSTNFARRCYLGAGPGEVATEPTSGLPARFEGVEPDDEALAPARANFAVLLVELTELDWFYLSNDGHRRARFDRVGEGWKGRWIAP